MEGMNIFLKFTMSHALLAIQNILQNSNIFIGSREDLFTPFGDKQGDNFQVYRPLQ